MPNCPRLHDGADGDLRPNLRSKDRKWEGVLRSSGPKNEDWGGSSIFGVEERRWGVLRSLAPKHQDGGFFDIRLRRSKMGVSSIFGAGRSKTPSSKNYRIFEEPPHLRRTPPIFEGPLHLRRTPHIRRIPHLRFSEPKIEEPLHPRSPDRRSKNPSPSSIFDLRPRRSKNPIYDPRPRRLARRSEQEDGGRGRDFFEDAAVLRKWRFLRSFGSKEQRTPYLSPSRRKNEERPPIFIFFRPLSSTKPHQILLRSISEISSCLFGPRPWHIEI